MPNPSQLVEQELSVYLQGHQYTLYQGQLISLTRDRSVIKLVSSSFIGVYKLLNNRVTKRRPGVNSVIS